MAVLCVSSLVGWGVYSSVHEERPIIERITICLRAEKGVTVGKPRDPIAQSAELGALRTVIETNGVTIAIAEDRKSAERIIAAYRGIADDLEEGRLERRGRLRVSVGSPGVSDAAAGALRLRVRVLVLVLVDQRSREKSASGRTSIGDKKTEA